MVMDLHTVPWYPAYYTAYFDVRGYYIISDTSSINTVFLHYWLILTIPCQSVSLQSSYQRQIKTRSHHIIHLVHLKTCRKNLPTFFSVISTELSQLRQCFQVNQVFQQHFIQISSNYFVINLTFLSETKKRFYTNHQATWPNYYPEPILSVQRWDRSLTLFFQVSQQMSRVSSSTNSRIDTSIFQWLWSAGHAAQVHTEYSHCFFSKPEHTDSLVSVCVCECVWVEKEWAAVGFTCT